MKVISSVWLEVKFSNKLEINQSNTYSRKIENVLDSAYIIFLRC